MRQFNTQSNSSPSTPHVTFGPKLGWTLCLLLLGNLIVQSWALITSGHLPPTSEAMAQNRSGSEPPSFPNNAAIAQKTEVQLMEINAKLARIEGTLSKPISVKVVESVPLTVANMPKPTEEAVPAPAPAPK